MDTEVKVLEVCQLCPVTWPDVAVGKERKCGFNPHRKCGV